MKSVPNVISTKDLSYLEDMLNWNFILLKKLNSYLNCVKDENVLKVLENAKKTLINDYEVLLNFLQ